jgi:hypothetical protein
MPMGQLFWADTQVRTDMGEFNDKVFQVVR